MKKILTKISVAIVGMAMAIGVGVAIGHKDSVASYADATYELVTDVKDLVAGTTVAIGTNELSGSKVKFMSTTQNTNNRGVTSEAAISSGVVTLPSNTQLLTLGKDGDNWTFSTGDGYLYAASSGSNHLKTQTELDNNGKWSVSITKATGVASVIAQGSNTRNVMQYNSSSGIFSCYGSASQGAVRLYKPSSSPAKDIKQLSADDITMDIPDGDVTPVVKAGDDPVTGFTLISGNENVLTIVDGKLHPVARGETTVTVSKEDTDTIDYLDATFTVTVTDSSYVFVAKTWAKITTIDELAAGQYLIVNEEASRTLDGALSSDKIDAAANTVPVTINAGIISGSDKIDAAAFSINPTAKTIQSVTNGYYIGTDLSKNSLKSSSNANDFQNSFAFDSGDAAIISNELILSYNKTSGQERFRYFTGNQQPIQLYKSVPPTIKVNVADNKTTLGQGDSTTLSTELLYGATGTPTFTTTGTDVITLVDNGDGTASVAAKAAGNATVTVALEGCENVNVQFTVLEKVVLNKIEVTTQPTKTEFIAGETIDLTGMVVTATYSNASTQAVTTYTTNASSINNKVKGEKTITVTYVEDEVTKTCEVKVAVKYESISVTRALEIAGALEDNGTTEVAYEISGVIAKIDGYKVYLAETYNEKNALLQLYNLSNEDSAKVIVGSQVKVEGKLKNYKPSSGGNILESVETVITECQDKEAVPTYIINFYNFGTLAKSTYYVGDASVDLTGLTFRTEDNRGVKTDVTSADYTVALPDMTTAGNNKEVVITHTASGLTTTVKINVVEVALSSIKVTTQPTKTTYVSGETFDKTGMVVTGVNNNGSEFLVDNANVTVNPETLKFGDTKVTLTYEGKTTTVNVTVTAPTLENIEIRTEPRNRYYVGEALNLKSLVVYAHYSDNTETKLSDTDYTTNATEIDMTTAGAKTLTVTYQEKTANCTINVVTVKEVVLNVTGARTIYRVGDTFSKQNVVITIVDSDDVEGSHTYTLTHDFEQYISTPDLTTEGEKDVTVTFQGASAKYTVEVWATAETLATAVTNAKAELDAYVAAKGQNNYTAENWTLVQELLADAKAALDDSSVHYVAQVTETVSDAKELIDEVPQLTELEIAKANAKAALDAAVAALKQADYSATNWEGIQTTLASAKNAIDADTTVEDVNSTKDGALVIINAVPTAAQEALETAKTDARNALNEAARALNQEDYSDANWTVITTARDNGLTAINNATTTEEVNTAKTNALNAIAAVKTTAQELADAKTAAKAEIEAYATSKGQSNYSEAGWTEIQGYVTMTKQAIDQCPSIAKVNEKLQAGKDLIDTVNTKAVEDLKAAKANAKDELANYYNGKDATKYDQEGINALVKAKEDGDAAIEAATTVEAVNSALANAKAALDAVKQVEPKAGGICGGDIAATSIILSTIALVGASLLVFRKRKED